MDFYQILSVFTCLSSTITLVLVAVAVVPHFKHGLTVIRDSVLWATLVLVMAFVVWAAWQRFSPKSLDSKASNSAVVEPQPAHDPARLTAHSDRLGADPFFQHSELP